MAKYSGADLVIRALRDEKIRHLFGIPGTHNIELYDALTDAQDLKTILVTDEQSASFMADGVWRASGEMACINLVPAAGLTNAMSGIAEAYLDQIPMLVLSCGIRQDTGASYQLHHVDQVAIAKPVCKGVFTPKTHAEIYPLLRQACQMARRAPCGPVMVEIPVNLYLFKENLDEEKFQFQFSISEQEIDPVVFKQIVEILNASRSVGIYVGLGALGARDGLIDLAEILDAIVFTTISGKGVFPEDHPRWAWMTLGRAAPPEIQKLEGGLDCLLAIGCRFSEVATASYGLTPPKNLIHVDIDPSVFNRNFKATCCLQADAKGFVDELNRTLSPREKNGQRISDLGTAHEKIRQDQRRFKSLDGVTPSKLIYTFEKIFGPETIYVTDSGNGTFVAMELLRLRHARSFLGPIDYSCMGYSVPASIGAKLARPDRPVVGLNGDGAFLMTGLELMTAKAQGIGVVSCVLRDGELSQIAQFQRTSFNRTVDTRLSPLNFHALAQAIGLDYIKIQNDDGLETGITEAYQLSQEGRPVLLEAAIDYSNPTYFTKGVVKTNFLRFGWKDRIRLVSRLIQRKITI